MTVTADKKKRVVLPPAKPGQVFDVQVSGDGRLLLTPLAPAQTRPARLVKGPDGYLVAMTDHPITQEQVRAYMDEFP